MPKPTTSEAEQIGRMKQALQVVGECLSETADDWRERLVEARECLLVCLGAIDALLPKPSRCDCPAPCEQHPARNPRNVHDKSRW